MSRDNVQHTIITYIQQQCTIVCAAAMSFA